jgi:O-antigen ligase
MMALVSLAVLCCKTSKSLGVICLLLSLFYGHLFLDSDSLLLAIPIGLAVGLTGRERVLALALLIVCLFELVLTRSEQYSPMGSRDTFFRQAKIAFLESPLLGKGDCGGYFESCDEYGMLAKHAHGHNIFVTNLCETGALGLLPLIPFLMFMILRAPNFDLAQKLFWGIFATWSMTDDPFNFVPFVPLVGLLLIHR